MAGSHRTVEIEEDVFVELERRKQTLGADSINAVLRKELNLDDDPGLAPCWRIRM